MKLCLISDTHLRHRTTLIDVPPCDLVIHAGDALVGGDREELQQFLEWFSELPARHKVYVAGNHDIIFEKEPELARAILPDSVTYLQDSGVEIEGLKIWGSPWQPEFYDWAFNLPRGKPLREKWGKIPAGLDILVTHTPPSWILDANGFGDPVGCEELRAAVNLKPPRLHVFGHVHGGYGVRRVGQTLFVNAAICNQAYYASHAPIIVEMDAGSVKAMGAAWWNLT